MLLSLKGTQKTLKVFRVGYLHVCPVGYLLRCPFEEFENLFWQEA